MRKVLVHDVAHIDPQQITPAEAELLMGWEHNCTAEPTVTAAQRLTAIGGGWDLNAVHSILRFSKMSNVNPLEVHPKVTQTRVVKLRQSKNMSPQKNKVKII